MGGDHGVRAGLSFSLTLYNGHSVVISYVIVILTYSYSTILLTVPFV